MSVRGSRADDMGRKLGAIIQRDADALGALHHVVVGDDGPVGIDDEARATRLDRVHLRLLRDHLIEREGQLRAALLPLHVLRIRLGSRVGQLCGNRDDSRLHLRDELREVGQRMRRDSGARRVDRGAGALGRGTAGLAADGGRRGGMADGEATERGAGE